MGLAIAVLTALLFSLPADAAAAASKCLGCHRSHYADKGGCASCHRGNDKTDRKRVAHDRLIAGKYAWHRLGGAEPVARGKRLMESLACRRCHISSGKGNRLAASLDVAATLRQPEELAASIRTPVRYMPDFVLTEHQAADLVNAVLAAGTPAAGREQPVTVHFLRRSSTENVFEKKCGGCHRALTSRHGGIGAGDAGPNLSGLLTPFYPASFKNERRWTVPRLKEWVANPRSVRATAAMRPVELDEKEWGILLGILE